MIKKWAALLSLACLPAALGILPGGSQASPQKSTTKPVYEVYAIAYGVLPQFPVTALVDGADLFPKAQAWIQKEEFNHYADPAFTRTAIDPDDLAVLQDLLGKNRLTLVDGDAKEIIPGITVYTGGKHTYASQYVGVSTRAGTVVVASDNLYLYENLEKGVAIAQTLDAPSNLQAQQRMKQLASSPRLIVPGHDPEVFVRFPKPGNGVARID